MARISILPVAHEGSNLNHGDLNQGLEGIGGTISPWGGDWVITRGL
jgi:hypothetical protein